MNGATAARGRTAPVVVFDIGNVLIRWDPRNLFRKTFADADTMEDFLATACSHDWLLELDAGDMSPHIAARVALFPQYREALTHFDTRWLEMLDGPIEENVAVFGELKARGHAVYGITNYSRDKFELSRLLFPFFDWFDGLVVSGREGFVKPDPRIFALLLARYGLAAADAIFVDDSLRNIAAARALGMDGVHFGPGVDLRRELVARGLLP